MQYLEGLFLIDLLVKKQLGKQEEINIVFALPNDEAKYYQDEAESFRKDVEEFLRHQNGDIFSSGKIKINIHFLNFPYGDESSHRPYNARTKNFKRIIKSDIYETQGDRNMTTTTIKSQPVNLAKLPAAVPGFADYTPQ